MIVLKWIAGILVGLAIINLITDWSTDSLADEISQLIAVMIMLLVEFVIIKG